MGDPSMPQAIAILRAMEERLTAIDDHTAALTAIATDPEGRVQQAQNDTLRIYGLVAQISEIMSIQRDQVLALADVIAVLVGRFVEHDKRVAAQHADMLSRLEALAHSVGQDAHAELAAEARRARLAEAEERAAELELSADQARELLSIASMDALAVVQRAVDRAHVAISDEAAAARGVVHAAESAAREQLSEERTSEQPE